MKTALCTISTQNHLFKSFALFDSVRKYSDTDLFCLVTDATEEKQHENIHFHFLSDLVSPTAQQLKKKYKGDKLRWSLKSIYVQFLLETENYDAVIYVDNDIYFFSSPDFLFQKLQQSDFLLTPHFYRANPQKNQNWLEANFRVGLYNAGFFGATKAAQPLLDWWAKCCLYEMKKSYWRGLHDDQKYLDLAPIIFDNVLIIKYKGCNLAGWNDENFVKEEQPIVFVHFAALTMERWRQTLHPLHDFYEEYLQALRHYRPEFQWKKKRFSVLYWRNVIYYLRWKFFTSI